MPKWQGVPCTRAWRGADRGKFSPEIRESSRPIYGGWLLKKSDDGRRSVCFYACATFFVCRKKKGKRGNHPHTIRGSLFVVVSRRRIKGGARDFFVRLDLFWFDEIKGKYARISIGFYYANSLSPNRVTVLSSRLHGTRGGTRDLFDAVGSFM